MLNLNSELSYANWLLRLSAPDKAQQNGNHSQHQQHVYNSAYGIWEAQEANQPENYQHHCYYIK